MKGITTLEEYDAIDDDVCVAGYRAGLGFTEVNYTRKERDYWHGYMNGQVDSRRCAISGEQAALARLVVERMRREGRSLWEARSPSPVQEGA